MADPPTPLESPSSRVVYASLRDVVAGQAASLEPLSVTSSERSKRRPWDEVEDFFAGRTPTLFSDDMAHHHNRLGIPPPAAGSSLFYRAAFALLTSSKFDGVIACVIVLNAITIGAGHTIQLDDIGLAVFNYVENAFLVIYTFELALRFTVQGMGCLRDNWVKFDAFLVVVGYVSLILLANLRLQGFEVMMVLRIVRMLRLCRTVRLLKKFRVLWMMVGGLLDSAGTMLHTLILLFTIIYVFASIGIELTANHPLASGEASDTEFAELVQSYFRNLPVTMLTLLQFVCLDSVAAIYKPLIEKDINSGSGFLVLYFVMVILIMPIVLMNIVTAVIVNRALEQASQDRDARMVFEEQEKKRTVKNLKKIFVRLDQDRSGAVSFEEIKQIEESDWVELQTLTSISNTEEIFRALDVDGNDRLDIDEFCQGIWQACISKVPVEIQRMEKQVSRMHQELRRTSAVTATISDAVGQICQELKQVREELHSQGQESIELDSSEKEMPAWGKLILAELQCIRREGQCWKRWVSDHDGWRQPSDMSMEGNSVADPGGMLDAEELVAEIAAGPKIVGVCKEHTLQSSAWSAREAPQHRFADQFQEGPVPLDTPGASLRRGHSFGGRQQKAATGGEPSLPMRGACVSAPGQSSSIRRYSQEPECPPSFRPQLMMVTPPEETL